MCENKWSLTSLAVRIATLQSVWENGTANSVSSHNNVWVDISAYLYLYNCIDNEADRVSITSLVREISFVLSMAMKHGLIN